MFHDALKLRLADLNYNFECDWLIYTTTLNVIGLLNCPIIDCPITGNCPITNCQITT